MHWLAIAASAPWVLVPIVTSIRSRHARTLDEVDATAPFDAPLVSVVIPARNESRNIERCVRSVLASTYPRLEVIAVDDHSTDDTGVILARIATEDARLRVVVPPPLPNDWFGKQWACNTGARAATGSVIAFFDADTWQTPDLLTRALNVMHDRNADMVSVLGRQELGTFWERIVQPQMFATIQTRYGGSESINESTRAQDKIANGQCIIVRHDAYVETSGHAAVRNRAAEDLALAQLWFSLGKKCVLVMGVDQLTTRMYTSLAELRAGWGKNIFAAGRETIPFGSIGRFLFPFLLLIPPIAGMAPVVGLVLSLLGVASQAVLIWSAIAFTAGFVWWATIYRWLEMPLRRSLGYALIHPLGAVILFDISLGALIRGRRVRWKDREYVAA